LLDLCQQMLAEKEPLDAFLLGALLQHALYLI
jgi:hypothetical protein